MTFVVDVHRWPDGQPLPPVPRQPALQTLFVSSQTRPDVTPPQSGSVLHPHWPFGRQMPPWPVGSQFVLSVGVHCTHWPAGLQICGDGQGWVWSHWTQTQLLPPPGHTHAGVGFVQLLLLGSQPWTQVPEPSPASVATHVAPPVHGTVPFGRHPG
jgi:hypothetical protein